MGPTILIKLAMNFFFLLVLSSCMGEGGTSAKKEIEFDGQYFIYSATSSVFEGTPLNLIILADKPYNKPRSIFWEIVDEWGQISTPYFSSDSGSLALMANEVELAFMIHPLKGMVPLHGKEFKVRVYIDHQVFIKTIFIKNLFSNDDGDSTVHTVSINSFTNAGIVNEENQVLFSFGGNCSTPEGAILLTVSSGSESVTKSETCGNSNEWYSSFNLSSLSDGVLAVNVKHSRGGIMGEDNAVITKDATPPGIAILSPHQNFGINRRLAPRFLVNGSCSENSQEVTIQAYTATGNNTEVKVLCLDEEWSGELDLSEFGDEALIVRASTQDSVLNTSFVQRNFFKDTVAPVLSFTSPIEGQIYNASQSSNVNASGTCNENGALITLSGGVETRTITCQNNQWFLSRLTLTEGEGPKVILATISDHVGNISFANRYVTKITTPPGIVLQNLPNSWDQVLKIRVEGEGVSMYRYMLGSDELDCEEENYGEPLPVSEEISDDLGEDGHKKICVISIDEFENTQDLSLATIYSWVKDTTLSAHISFNNPLENTMINSLNEASFSIQGACSTEGVENITINVDFLSQNIDCVGNTWTVELDLSLVPDGDVVISATHESETVSRKFFKYTSSPALSFTLPIENSFINKKSRRNFVISGECNLYSEENNILITGGVLDVNVGCDGEFWNARIDFPDNITSDITLTASMIDEDDNEAIATRTFRLDTEDPLVGFSLPLEGSDITSLNASSLLVSGVCSEDGVANVEVFYNSTSLGVTDCELGSWTAIVDLTLASEGPLTLGVTHSDQAFNKKSSFRIFEKIDD